MHGTLRYIIKLFFKKCQTWRPQYRQDSMVDFEENAFDDADSSDKLSEISVEDVALLTFQVETAINVSTKIATRLLQFRM